LEAVPADPMDLLQCDSCPCSSTYRGANEHLNGRIRHYLAKRARFDDLPQEEPDAHVRESSHRPREILDWGTPAEVF
jgi:IS30 family transposase